MLTIRLLGTPLVLLDDKPLTITRKKSRALVYYLAAHDNPSTREQILAVFWPDSDRASAQQSCAPRCTACGRRCSPCHSTKHAVPHRIPTLTRVRRGQPSTSSL
jgi:hypothetical protein